MTIDTIGTAGDFSTIQGWYDNYKGDITSDANAPYIGELKDEQFDECVNFEDSTTDVTHYFHLRPQIGANPVVAGDGSAGDVVRVEDDYFRITNNTSGNITISGGSLSAGSDWKLGLHVSGDFCFVDSIIVKDIENIQGNSNSFIIGISMSKSGIIRNCLVYNLKSENSSDKKGTSAKGIVATVSSSKDIYIYNNTVHHIEARNNKDESRASVNGIVGPPSSLSSKIYNNVVGDLIVTAGEGTVLAFDFDLYGGTHDYNAATDTTVSGEAHGQPSIDTSLEFTNKEISTLDLSINKSTSVDLLNNGFDLVTAGYTNATNEDFYGFDRSKKANWDIGAILSYEPVIGPFPTFFRPE